MVKMKDECNVKFKNNLRSHHHCDLLLTSSLDKKTNVQYLERRINGMLLPDMYKYQ